MKKKPVEKRNKADHVIDRYDSIMAAADANFITRVGMRNRCRRGKAINLADGTYYQFIKC